MMMFLEWEETLLKDKLVGETFLKRKPSVEGNWAQNS